MSTPLVAIVGRPNVGKSALLNRLIQSRDAIVESSPGVTRDRIYRETEWQGRRFRLVDTGGILLNDPDEMKTAIRMQVEIALDEADLILFVVDIRSGLHPMDRDVAEMLRKTGKDIILAANKADNVDMFQLASDFYALGMGNPFQVSSIHGIGTGDLLDEVIEKLPETVDEKAEEVTVRISIVGRPNVGKSSIMNALLGRDRCIVTNSPGTTRDAIDSDFEWGDKKYKIVDTAGLRKKRKVSEGIEYYSTTRARKSIKGSHVCLLVLDATDPAVMQDKKIAGIVEEWGKSLVITVNKWDLVEKKHTIDRTGLKEGFAKEIRGQMDFLFYAPIIFTSAIEGKGIDKIMPTVNRVYHESTKRVETPVLNRLVQDAFFYRPPPSYKGDMLKMYYVHQKSVCPPTFVFKVNSPKLVHFSYRRYLENQIRRVLNFEGAPIRMIFKK